MGSMPNAVKAKDLQRDPRCCIITPLADKDDLAGEAKLFCRAREIDDADEWEVVRKAFLDLRGFDMGDSGGSHLFTYDIDGAALQRVEGDDWRTSSWTAGDGERAARRIGESATAASSGESHRTSVDVGWSAVSGGLVVVEPVDALAEAVGEDRLAAELVLDGERLLERASPRPA